MTKKEAELLRRRKSLFVYANDIVQLLFISKNHDKISLIDASLPEDTRVVGVHSSFKRNGFWLNLISTEFPITEEGVYPEEIKDSGLRIIREFKKI